MAPSHTVHSRPLTEAERHVIEGTTRPQLASYGCLAILFGVVPVCLLSACGRWIARNLFPGHVVAGRLIGGAAGAGVFIFWFVKFALYERRQRRRCQRDADAPVVQEITVRDPRVIEIGLVNDNAPILAFDIGQGKILFLQGQWLFDDPSLYGAPPNKDGADEEFVNGLPAPYSFPSTEFILSRFPHSGMVLSIRPSGKYLAPEKSVEALRREFEFGPSDLFEGDLDQIAKVLAREHEARFFRRK